MRLGKELVIYSEDVLDMKKVNETEKIQIPPEGIILQPGKLYLGTTLEYTESNTYVPSIEGRSSLGRLGLSIHVSSPYGNIGFKGYWTLEFSCVQPVRIYEGIEVCQIYFHEILGDYLPYTSKYQNNQGVQPSFMYKEFDN